MLIPRRGTFLIHNAAFLERQSLAFWINNVIGGKFNVFNKFDKENLVFEDDCSLVHEDFEEEVKASEEKVDVGSESSGSGTNNEIVVEKVKADL
jgi:hypothetical protein